MKIAAISFGLWMLCVSVVVLWNFVQTLDKTNTEDDDE